MIRRSLVLACLIGALDGMPAEADPTPALPFWSQPFPSGFAGQDHPDRVGSVHEPCPGQSPTPDRRFSRRRPCRPPLRVMD